MPSGDRGAAAQRPLDVATDRWTMSGQWAARTEDESQCADRLLRFLKGIGSLHPALGRWRYNDAPVDLSRGSLATLLAEGRDRQFPEHGYRTALWNGDSEPTEATVTVTCGSTAPYVKNSFSLELPQPAAVGGLYGPDAMRTLINLTVSIWQPSWCSVGPYGVWQAADRGGSIGVFASWIAYLDRDLIRGVGDLPPAVHTADVGAGKVFMMAPTPDQITLDDVNAVLRAVELDPAWRLSPSRASG